MADGPEDSTAPGRPAEPNLTVTTDLTVTTELTVTTVATGDGRLILLVRGDLDIATSDRVLEPVLDALDAPDVLELLIDLSRTSFIDASGAFVLQRCRAAWSVTGRRLSVVGATGMVAEVLCLTDVA